MKSDSLNVSFGRSRPALTLVEILVAITVVAILGAILMAGIFPALNRAREAAIQVEMKQLESAIEEFKTEFGFYPPSFKQFAALTNDSDRVALMNRYLNRISRDHTENILGWWTAVGQHIRYQEGEDLVFWLSALHKNRQFPLSGGQPTVTANFDNGGDRHGFYDFKSQQFFVRNVGSAQIASYMQQANTETPFRYLDAASYAIPSLPDGMGPFGTQQDAGGGNLVFIPFNAETFQLIAPGLDNQLTLGGPVVVNPPGLPPDTVSIGLIDDDNIANFANGRLDAFVDSFRD